MDETGFCSFCLTAFINQENVGDKLGKSKKKKGARVMIHFLFEDTANNSSCQEKTFLLSQRKVSEKTDQEKERKKGEQSTARRSVAAAVLV